MSKFINEWTLSMEVKIDIEALIIKESLNLTKGVLKQESSDQFDGVAMF